MTQHKRNGRSDVIKNHLRGILVACLMVLFIGLALQGGIVNTVGAQEQVFYSNAANPADPQPSPSPSPGCGVSDDNPCRPVDDNGGGILPGILPGILSALGLA